jgi:RNA polymerase subunit RPABC4/transcription elongation factor Spt4
MIRSIRDNVQKFQHRLTRLDNEPLSIAALIVILFLDAFILFSIFDGLADHTGQLTTPEQHIPPLCREMVIDENWNATNALDSLASMVARHHQSYFTSDERDENKPQHAVCVPISRAYKAVRGDEALSQSLIEVRKLWQEMRELRTELERMKGAYDTSLLEDIAGQKAVGASVTSIQKEVADKTAALDVLARKQALIEATLERDPRIRELLALATGVSKADRNLLRDDLRRLNFWHPVKRLGMEMLFLLPLLLIFWFWNSRSIIANRAFQTLISSHLLIVVLLPVFFKVLELIYDIIPHKLLKKVIEILVSLKLVAVWHYLLIGVAILIALALIYLFQKKLFSREKLMQRRIAKSLCQSCGQRLGSDSSHCPACGAGQYRVCKHCQAPTYVQGRFCRACGRAAG